MAYAEQIHCNHIADGKAKLVDANAVVTELEPMSDKEFAAVVVDYQNTLLKEVILIEEAEKGIKLAQQREEIARNKRIY